MSSVTIDWGSEGPKHDPYGWTEITVDRPDGKTVTLHAGGLIEWVEVDGVKHVNLNYEDCCTIFAHHAGVTPDIAERAYQKYRSRCRECGGTETESKAGFPGETFELCVKCGAMVDYNFNESAII